MANASNPKTSRLPERLEEWFRSFVPTETAIDGGLYPDRLGEGMLGFDYASFKLAGEHEALPDVDPESADDIDRRFGAAIPDRESLKPKK